MLMSRGNGQRKRQGCQIETAGQESSLRGQDGWIMGPGQGREAQVPGEVCRGVRVYVLVDICYCSSSEVVE